MLLKGFNRIFSSKFEVPINNFFLALPQARVELFCCAGLFQCKNHESLNLMLTGEGRLNIDGHIQEKERTTKFQNYGK